MKKETLFNCYVETDENNEQWLVREFSENSQLARKGSRIGKYTEQELINLISNDVSEQIHIWFKNETH